MACKCAALAPTASAARCSSLIVSTCSAASAAAVRARGGWDHPERFDVARDGGGRRACGRGSNVGLGASLGRLEARIALGAFLRRFPDFTGAPDPPDWKRSIVLRGPTALPVRLS